MTLDRLEDEYNVKAHLTGVNYAACRWVEGPPEIVEDFESKNIDSLFRDANGDLAYLAMSEWRLDRTIENWPSLEFKRTKQNTAGAS